MTPELWGKVKSGFNLACEMPPAKRSDFLAGLDDDVCAEIERMLAAEDGDAVLLNEPAIDLEHFPIAEIPQTIGDYKIEREIGSGGMGTVYEAWRETETFRQHVAVKVVRSGFDNRTVLARFRSEQKILASLEHPNIARFLDGGTTATGQPYYAMEFVDGIPIDEYCRIHNLELTAKLDLFRKACSALTYAHSRLIVHRDLKPSNILVTSDGTPKLLDFGIAKVLESEIDGLATATQLGMMTPQYASPEQIRGLAVTALSDVYSLGLLLYEIVAGEKPYITTGCSLADVLEVVTNTQPVRPSVAAALRLGNRSSLSSDVDTIVMKALQKDPSRRYASVEHLSEDLRRFLNGHPISARPDTVSYRLKKFVGRNRVSAAAGVLLLVTLLTGIIISTWQAYRAEEQRHLAEKRFADVRALANNVLFKYHDEIARLEGSTAVRQMLVADALQYLDAIAADAGDDLGLKIELASAYIKLGDAQGKMYDANVGNTEGAVSSYSKAIELLESVVAVDPKNIGVMDELVKACDLQLALMARTSASVAEKRSLVDRSIEIIRTLVELEPDSPKRLGQLVTVYIRKGDAVGDVSNRNSLIEKLEAHLTALPLLERIQAIAPEDIETIRLTARLNQRLGTDYYWLGENAATEGDPRDALVAEYFQQALAYHTAMAAAVDSLTQRVPDDASQRRLRVASSTSLSESLARNGRYQEAIAATSRGLRQAERTRELDAGNREALFDLGLVHQTFATVYRLAGDDRKAIEHCQKALEINSDFVKLDEKNFEALRRSQANCRLLAEIYRSRGNLAKASEYEGRIGDLQAVATLRIARNPG